MLLSPGPALSTVGCTGVLLIVWLPRDLLRSFSSAPWLLVSGVQAFAFNMHCLQILTEMGQTDTQFGPEFEFEMLLAINPWAGEGGVYQGKD